MNMSTWILLLIFLLLFFSQMYVVLSLSSSTSFLQIEIRFRQKNHDDANDTWFIPKTYLQTGLMFIKSGKVKLSLKLNK